ncbi:MAG TPA: isochorismatase family protein [Stellaceae bacterium]|nr:isochorismatase family protein [Stellaceae bacterium]
MGWVRRALWVAVFGAIVALTPGPRAETIIDAWASVPSPSPPALKPVTVDAKTTALLLLDLLQQNCGKRPHCAAQLPAIAKLLAEVRSKGMTVVYSYFPGAAKTDILPQLAPKADEPTVQAFADKFNGTDLETMLKAKGVKSVIIVGTSANGAVLYTASEALWHGFDAIVPVDGISANTPFAEKLAAWQLANGVVAPNHLTLTTIDMIHF